MKMHNYGHQTISGCCQIMDTRVDEWEGNSGSTSIISLRPWSDIGGVEVPVAEFNTPPTGTSWLGLGVLII